MNNCCHDYGRKGIYCKICGYRRKKWKKIICWLFHHDWFRLPQIDWWFCHSCGESRSGKEQRIRYSKIKRRKCWKFFHSYDRAWDWGPDGGDFGPGLPTHLTDFCFCRRCDKEVLIGERIRRICRWFGHNYKIENKICTRCGDNKNE